MPRPLRRRAALVVHETESRRLRRIAGGTGPVVAGPWTGDVGLELLYWLPFLRWLTTEGGVDPTRVVAVSRGGVGDWYADVSNTYVDLHDHFPADRVMRWGDDSDRRAVELAQESAGIERSERLHPSLLRRLFGARWEHGASSSVVSAHTTHASLPAGAPANTELPGPYAAVKLDFNEHLPNTAANRDILRRTVEWFGERMSVVCLQDVAPGRESFVPETTERVQTIVLEPSRSLAEQSAIVRNADVFVSTYTGCSYLGPYVETPTIALYSDAPSDLVHLDLIDRVGRQLGDEGSRLFRARHVGSLSTAGE
jgi:hypothetical protein